MTTHLENDNLTTIALESTLAGDLPSTPKKAWHAIKLNKLGFQHTEGGSIGGVSDASLFHS